MLMKDPKLRPTLSRISQHPFLTKQAVSRLPGEVPKWDVFISYRVASDAKYAEQFYQELTAQGLSVWMVRN